MTKERTGELSIALERLLSSPQPEGSGDYADVFAFRLLSWEPDVPLTAEQETAFVSAARDAFAAAGPVAVRFDGEAPITLLLAHVSFPARFHRETLLWLCVHQLAESCAVSLEQEGTLLVGEEFSDPAQWLQALTPMHDPSEWWSLTSPMDGPEAHRHRAALQTIVKRRQYSALPGYVTRALRAEKEPGIACFALIPPIIEAVWSMHAEQPLRILTQGLSLSEMARRPREALLSWLTELASCLRACPTPASDAPVERVVAAIRLDCSLPYSQANLSRSLGLTPAYFCRLFREKTGQHFSNFLTITRMEHAQELLRAGGMSLQEVSDRCGYPNKSYFCQVFKKYTGLTPGEYETRALLSAHE